MHELDVSVKRRMKWSVLHGEIGIGGAGINDEKRR
jgi:hypothetical protein